MASVHRLCWPGSPEQHWNIGWKLKKKNVHTEKHSYVILSLYLVFGIGIGLTLTFFFFFFPQWHLRGSIDFWHATLIPKRYILQPCTEFSWNDHDQRTWHNQITSLTDNQINKHLSSFKIVLCWGQLVFEKHFISVESPFKYRNTSDKEDKRENRWLC